ncbi:alpha/beta fold hydrolase [Planctomonas sp. JC2975]|uniref:alpha/beta fold hydrolase n=1 Tax=Planctomonas sp. JC2975 TaxID=2729626 RepID=UPI0014733CCD|nr:alpha/beta fold hydrolase [Planctomonas sp. JC2975]
MRFTSETVTDGIREQLFTLGEIPGVLWTPADATTPRPLVLIGHGGGSSKKGWEVTSRAFPFVTTCGFAVAAIDAPGTGDRPFHPEVMRLVAVIDGLKDAGQSFEAEKLAMYETVVAELIPDWQKTLDALQQTEFVDRSRPIGYYGLSQGGELGIRLVADEPRIGAAVLGLVGSEWLLEPASRITVPVEYLLQWNDDGNPRDDVMRLFGALGSAEKTLHANPGSHFGIPMFEIDSAVRFFARHLGEATVVC